MHRKKGRASSPIFGDPEKNLEWVTEIQQIDEKSHQAKAWGCGTPGADRNANRERRNVRSNGNKVRFGVTAWGCE